GADSHHPHASAFWELVGSIIAILDNRANLLGHLAVPLGGDAVLLGLLFRFADFANGLLVALGDQEHGRVLGRAILERDRLKKSGERETDLTGNYLGGHVILLSIRYCDTLILRYCGVASPQRVLRTRPARPRSG